jgi:CRISPR-associated protein Csx10
MTGLPARFPVRVCMLSDWIVGTGEGRVGDVDATVRRDYDGLPFLPAKTLTGIWRDACEQVVAFLCTAGADAGLASPWQVWLDWIFGSQPDEPGDQAARRRLAPQRAQLALSPARLSGQVRAACQGKPPLLAAAVVVRPGVKIDDETGVASEDMLRVEERARPQWLEAEADFPFLTDPELPLAAEFLLRAGAAAVEALGGKRNRGAGRCWILPPGIGGGDVDDLDAATFPIPATARPADHRLAELAADTGLLDDPGEPPAPGEPAARLSPFSSSAANQERGGRRRVSRRVTLEVLTPLVAQDRVLGNVTMSRDWLPGTVLLPVILSRLSRRVGHLDITVGDARPAARSGAGVEPGVRVPMVWYRPKDRSWGQLVNAAQRRPDATERMMPMRSGHIARAEDGTWSLLAPQMAVSTHAVIGDDTGRPDSGRGGVFSYLGIAPGTLLAFDIVLPEDVDLTLAAGEVLRLGRSRKDDFGQAKVTSIEVCPAPAATELQAGEQLPIWCVSDVLLRDEWGACDPSPHALAAALSARLGLEEATSLTVADQQPGGPAVHAYRAARRESVHTKWNRPRPSLTGLAAGSVVTLTTSVPIPAAALAEIERDGIGERTAEGFGQVRFGAPELATPDPVVTPPGTLQENGFSAEPLTADRPLPAVPHVLEVAAVKAEIARRVAAVVAPESGIDKVIPEASRIGSRAQWGVLREQLPRLASPAGRDAVAAWLEQTRTVRTRRLAWSKPALDALERLFTDPAAVWSDLGLEGTAMNEFALAPERADQIRAALWPHAVSVLLTQTARTATRRLQAGHGEEESR